VGTLLYWQRYMALEQRPSAKLCGVVQGMELRNFRSGRHLYSAGLPSCWASARCPVCLSIPPVTLVYCGQTVGWIKMKLGMQVVLGPGHIVLDGDPAPPPQKGGRAPNFRRFSVVAKLLH